VAPRAYEVAFRSVLGKEHVLAYLASWAACAQGRHALGTALAGAGAVLLLASNSGEVPGRQCAVTGSVVGRYDVEA
jgi:hypothetical protein